MMALTRRHLISTSVLAGLTPLLPETAWAQTAPAKTGGILTSLLTPEPPILVLGVNNQGPTGIVASKIYEGLLEFSPKLEPLPRLAKSWELSDDKKTYTFHLAGEREVPRRHADDVEGRAVLGDAVPDETLAPCARRVQQDRRTPRRPTINTVQFTLDARRSSRSC